MPSPDWLRNKGATINPQNTKDNYCFMYAVTIALNQKELRSHPERISAKLISHIPKYNWDYIDFPASMSDYRIFEKNNQDIALNVLYVSFNEQEIRPEYISEHNLVRNSQVTLLNITNNKGTWHFLALKSESTEDGYMRPAKSLSRLMRDQSSNSHENYCCYGCFHSFRCQSTLEKHTLKCKDHKYCKIILPEKDKNFKRYKHGTKSLRMNDIIYLDLECLLLKYDSCSNNHTQSERVANHQEKAANHQVCGCSTTIVRNHSKEIITTYYRREDTLSKLCKELREKALILINIEKKELIPLTGELQKNMMNVKNVIYGKKYLLKMKVISIIRILKKLSIMIITQGNIEVQPLVYVTYDMKHKKIFQL